MQTFLLNSAQRLVACFTSALVILTLSFGLIGCSSHGVLSTTVPAGPQFYGINQVPAEELKTLLPALKDQPVLVEFSSKLCRECIEMEPIVKELQQQHPHVLIQKLDVARDKEAKKAIIEAFKPTIVPVLVFITPKGEIKAVLYGFHKRDDVEHAFAQVDA